MVSINVNPTCATNVKTALTKMLVIREVKQSCSHVNTIITTIIVKYILELNAFE